MSRAHPPLASVRSPVIVGLLALALLIAGFGGWATQTRLAGAIIAPGYVELAGDRQVVQHPEGGVVTEIAVRDGARVKAGEVLLRLETGPLLSELAITEARLLELRARQARLEAERDGHEVIQFLPELADSAPGSVQGEVMDGQRRLHAAARATHAAFERHSERRAGYLRQRIAELTVQARATDRQARLVADERQAQEGLLARGLVPAARVMALRREAARLDGAQAELRALVAQTEGELAVLDMERTSREAVRREEAIARLRDLRLRAQELHETRAAQRARIARAEIRAPVDGVVHGLRVHTPRAVLRPAEPILALVPEDDMRVVIARISPVDIDRVVPGQRVTLRFPGLDDPESSDLAAWVETISPDVVEEDGRFAPHYRARLALTQEARRRLTGRAKLVPGMPVEAYVRTGDHTPLYYLAEPLTTYFSRAFRE